MLRAMPALHETWGSRVRSARVKRGWTIAELAYRADVNPGNLSRIERGLERPGDEVRIRIADALGVRVESIWSYPSKAAS